MPLENRSCKSWRSIVKRYGPVRNPLPIVAVLLLIGGLFGMSAAWTTLVRAQQVSSPTLVAVATLRAEAATRVPLPIKATLPDAVAKRSFVRLRGVPVTAALSEGHVIGPGMWAVPLAVLPALEIIFPAGINGEATVSISLVTVDGEVLAETRMRLVIAASAQPAVNVPAPARAAPAVVPQPPAVPTQSPEERERIRSIHNKGVEQLDRGNIHAARKFFERAAEAGSAPSALALARTYDPDELATRKVIGLQADIVEARKWYERANELGAAEAPERLRRLSGR